MMAIQCAVIVIKWFGYIDMERVADACDGGFGQFGDWEKPAQVLKDLQVREERDHRRAAARDPCSPIRFVMLDGKKPGEIVFAQGARKGGVDNSRMC